MRFRHLTSVLILGLSWSSCKSVSQNSLSKADAAPQGEVEALNIIESREEFASLARPNEISYPFIRYSYFYGVDSGDPIFNKIFFQNTNIYESHVSFLSKQFPRYKDVKNYDELILPPQGNESGPSIKEITAGALYYRPATGTEAEVLAFEVHFRSEVNDKGTVKTKIDVAELARLDKILKQSVTFVADSAIKFVIPEKADFFTYKSKLDAAGVGYVKSWEFHKAPLGAHTYVAAKSYGYLRNLTSTEFENGLYTDKDILVFANIPLDVGPVAGIIVEKAAAAHAHVIFRADNLKVPAVYIPSATTVPEIKANLGKLISFTTRKDGTYTIESEASNPALKSEAEAYWASRRKVVETPFADLSVTTIKAWNRDGVSPADIKSYGAKATNFGILDNALQTSGVDRARYQNGFMVPFHFFDKHMNAALSPKLCADVEKKCAKDVENSCSDAAKTCASATPGTLKTFVAAMLAEPNRSKMNSEPAHRRQYLAFVQRLIREAPLAPETLEAVHTAMTKYPPTTRMRLRSSTNAEDIQGLNGAGLYESKSGCLGDDEKAKDDDGKPSACRTAYESERMKRHADLLRSHPDPDGKLKILADELIADITKKYPLSKAIRNVYGSLWTERAFLTREFYGLKHEGIYMGMLSHPSFVDESANGVAIIEFTNDKPSILKVEAQCDDISVTNPIFPDTVPEHWTARYNGALVENMTLVTASSLKICGNNVLSREELAELGRQLATSATALRKARGGDRYDLEFILDKDRIVLIKQGRPL